VQAFIEEILCSPFQFPRGKQLNAF
jgi:hypothetical protein